MTFRIIIIVDDYIYSPVPFTPSKDFSLTMLFVFRFSFKLLHSAMPWLFGSGLPSLPSQEVKKKKRELPSFLISNPLLLAKQKIEPRRASCVEMPIQALC